MVFLDVEGLVPGASLLGNTHLSFGFIPKGFHWGRILGSLTQLPKILRISLSYL